MEEAAAQAPPPLRMGGLFVQDKDKDAITQRIASMEEERRDCEPEHRELEENFSIRQTRFTPTKRKRQRNTKIINGTPLYSVTVMKSGMMSGHTSPSRPWFKLVAPDPGLMEVEGVRSWLYTVETRMREVFARSNVYNALPTVYGDLGTYGTGAMGVFRDLQDTIRCYPYMVGSYGIANSPRLSVNCFSRKWKDKAWNIVHQFGRDNVSTEIGRCYDNKQFMQRFEVNHLLEPNPFRNPDRDDFEAMDYRSLYWESSFPQNRLLKVEGFRDLPVLVARWETEGEDAWGNSPGTVALGDAKQLQFEELSYAQVLDQIRKPPLKIDPSLRNKTQLGPGGKNYISMTAGNPGIEAIYQPHPQALQYVREGINTLETRVKQHLFVDMFLMLQEQDRSGVTAREVEEKHSEKLLMLGPILERLSDELLDPLIRTTFRIMLETGMIPVWPQELDGKPVKIEYISILAQAQKMASTHAIEAVAGYASTLAAVSPDAMDKLDIDNSIDEYAQLKGAPPTIIRSDEAVANIRRQRQQQQAAAQAAASAMDAAKAAHSLGNTPMGQDSALDRLTAG